MNSTQYSTQEVILNLFQNLLASKVKTLKQVQGDFNGNIYLKTVENEE